MTERVRLTADWLADPRLIRLLAAIGRDGDAARIVGGAVRNTLMGLPVADIDVATTALPGDVMARALAAQMKPVPTGIAHGTVTVVVDGTPFEVTTLRRDVESHGRHATVEFGRDWQADARRRDFTVNALYAEADGTVLDPVGGVDDCAARRIRFIGRPEDRIGEDYLRILRFFRFHAAYGEGSPDADGLAACIALQDGIDILSAERLGQEMKKLAAGVRALETLAVMDRSGILARVLGQLPQVGPVTVLFDLVRAGHWRIERPEPLLVLACLVDDGEALGFRLRLSRAETERMALARAAIEPAALAATGPDLRKLAHRHARRAAADGLVLAVAEGRAPAEGLAVRLAEVDAFDPGPPPVRGRDILALGIDGPRVGDLVRAAEDVWISSDFTLGKREILARIGL